MTEHAQNAEAVFLSALELATPPERTAFVEKACTGNPDLLRRVLALLASHDASRGPLDARPPSLTNATIELPPPMLPGTVIGPYKLLQQIGEGGMGVVYMAEQTQPVHRKVALKIIKPGMDSRQVIARFEAERQALAMMDHVNIARVIDGGTISSPHSLQGRGGEGEPGGVSPESCSGRPYFVMELIHGIPITKYCDDNHLTPRERLELFVPVCQAVQHAHQKGIIHRDIKPSNVLVTLYDGKPIPKVIDFGVAKAIDQKLTDNTLFTNFGTMVGTLEYMSPEQAEMSNLGVDTRSDIYSLGVLLYELLTGSTPLTHKRLKEAAYGEILRMIREEEAPKPSTRLNDSGEALASISAQRHMEPAKLSKLMRGELDWIVMKTLEKDRNRRYETANAFVADMLRYLYDEPVEACPPSGWYRFRKFARRNKAPLLVGASLAALLVMGIVGTSISLAWALQAERAAMAAAIAEAEQRRLAETQRDKAVAAEKQAVAEKIRANEVTLVATAVLKFFQDDVLAEAMPERNARNKKVTVEEVVDRAAARIAGRFDQRPSIEAGNRLTIGNIYRQLGNYRAALPHVERAYELFSRVFVEENSYTLTAMNDLARLYDLLGQPLKAEPLFVKALDVRRRILGQEHPDTLISLSNLANIFEARGEFSKAEEMFLQGLDVSRRSQGEEHPDTLLFMNNLGQLYLSQKQFTKAEPLLAKTLEISRRVKGEEHPRTLSSLNNLARLYHMQGQLANAEPLLVKSLESRRRVLGEEHPDTLIALNNLALLYFDQKQLPKAESLFIQTLEIRRRILGQEHSETFKSIQNLAAFYQNTDQYTKADVLYRELLEKTRRHDGAMSPPAALALHLLGMSLLKQLKYADAELQLRECLKIREQKMPDDWATFNTKMRLGESLLGQKKYAEAEPLLTSAYEGMVQRESKIPSGSRIQLTLCVERLVQLYDAMGRVEKASEWRKVLNSRKEANKNKENKL